MAKSYRKADKEGLTGGVIVCLIVGGFLLYFGSEPWWSDGVPRCGGEVMTPGTRCKNTRNGSVTGYTSYGEAKSHAQAPWATHNTIMVIIGVLILLAAVYFLWRRIKASW